MPSYSQLVRHTREVFRSGRTRSIEWRKQQLKSLVRLLDENEDAICEALRTDLGKHKLESLLIESGLIRNDAILTINNLDEWTKPQPQKRNLMTLTDTAEIIAEPYGVTLIMGAWNYPIQLPLLPLVGAIAAGNCAIIKPSEVAEASAKLISELIPQYLDPECFPVVTGGIPETTALLEEPFDHIFFTGSSVVGKIVYQAAAKHLTPVTLELGGKSPCYVGDSSDADVVARRVIWGKLVNCGQTCVAPDYVLCQAGLQEKLLSAIERTLKQNFGEVPMDSECYGRIVNEKHYQRVKGLLSSSRVAIGGQFDDARNKVAPTVLVDVRPTDPAMQEEVFGPILPIMTVVDEDEAIAFINSREKPLALYIFTKNKAVARKIINNTSSGGVTVNDTLMHGSVPSLPFGGVGASGVGAYHGKHTFDAFSHQRAVLLRAQNMEKLNDLRYPPYSENKLKMLKFILDGKIKEGRGRFFSFIPYVLIGVIVAYFVKTNV